MQPAYHLFHSLPRRLAIAQLLPIQRRFRAICLILIAGALAVGCTTVYSPRTEDSANAVSMTAANLNDPVQPEVIAGPATLSAARNEWTSFIIQLSHLPDASADHPLS